tara:strand:+ start:2778 stop:3374 length:597 start_codon:yes stop_codon:yes gene_type:complete
MKEVVNDPEKQSITRVIASGGPFQVELIEFIGEKEHKSLIKISKSLIKEYGEASKLTDTTINTYFNKVGSLPFIARHQGQIIGYIIGVPLENLSMEPWARLDANFGENNTIYTYAFVINSKYKKNGYAKMLKKVFLNSVKKKDNILYITGHVRKGITKKFKGNIKIIDEIENWQRTGKIFEYYRRELDPDRIYGKNLG